MGYSDTFTGYADSGTIRSLHEIARFGGAVAMPHNSELTESERRGEHQAVPAAIVADEAGWRSRPASSKAAMPRIIATRWASSAPGIRDVSAETPGDGYVVGLALRQMNLRLSVCGRVVQDGVASAGMMHVSEPSTPAHCLFRGPYDVLHLHVPNDLLIECSGEHVAGTIGLLRSDPAPVRDPVALQLGLALLKAEEFAASFGWIYADGIGLAIVTRLLALQAKAQTGVRRTEVVALSDWRFKRAADYIDAHLDAPVSLADVAAASGLSRTYFAAQFKAATGWRPHEYVLRRRISRAQEMIRTTTVPLVDVCLQVGFQSQAHFTTVFKRVVGQTPHAWRQSCGPV